MPAKRYPLAAVLIVALTFWAGCIGLANVANWMLGQ